MLANRTAPPGLIADRDRWLTGAALSLGGGSRLSFGAGLGLIGGYRRLFCRLSGPRSARKGPCARPDLTVALLEDLVAIGGSLFSSFPIQWGGRRQWEIVPFQKNFDLKTLEPGNSSLRRSDML